MLDKISEAREEIKAYIADFLEAKKEEYSSVNVWSSDLFVRLEEFINNGKMLRGGMVIVGHDLLNGKHREAAVMSAAAIELIHSAFLIHDDIMDRDQLRRGKETVYYQYEQMGAEKKYVHPYAFGQALGICAGDEAFFLAYDLLISLPIDQQLLRPLLSRVTHEMKRVGLAQMQDVVFGHSSESPSLVEILNVYRYKTAYYTFSMPLFVAALLGEQTDDTLAALEKIGEALGIIFQLKDDDLGIFGEEKTIGKPSGSDIREDKKTVFRHYLQEAAHLEDLETLEHLFGKKSLTAEEIQWVRDLSISRGVRDRIRQLINEYEQRIRSEAQNLAKAISLKPLILDLLDYSLERTY